MSPEHLPREIAARGVHKVLTETIISQGESPRSRTGRSVVRGKKKNRQKVEFIMSLLGLDGVDRNYFAVFLLNPSALNFSADTGAGCYNQ